MFGGDGNDLLDGGDGSGDLLFGGTGSDIFVIDPEGGRDTIGDLETGDLIDVRGLGLGFGDLALTPVAGGVHVSGTGLDVDVALDPGETLGSGDLHFDVPAIIGTDSGSVTEDNLIFAGGDLDISGASCAFQSGGISQGGYGSLTSMPTAAGPIC